MRFLKYTPKRTEKGFSLIEILVVVAITGVISVAISQIIFVMMDVVTGNRAHVDVIVQVQNAERWLEMDVKMAQTVEVVRNDPSHAGTLMLTWHTWGGTKSSVNYFIRNNQLMRYETEYSPTGGTRTYETFIAKDVVSGSPQTSFVVSTEITKRKSVHVHITVENDTGTSGMNREVRDFEIDPRPIY